MTTPQPQPDSQRRVAFQLSPILTMALAVLGVFAVLLATVIVLSRWRPKADLSGSLLAQATMPDGTLLSVLAFQHGTGFDQLPVTVPGASFPLFGPGTRIQTLRAHFSQSQISLWLTRRNPATGESLDFDWWQHSTVSDQFGNEIEDAEPFRHVVSMYSSGSSSGSRPFPAEHSRPGHEGLIVAGSGFPLFRAGPTILLKIYNVRNELVAEFQIPNVLPPPSTAVTLAPQTLPATKSVDGLEITLKELRTRQHVQQQSERQVKRISVEPAIDIRRDGAVLEDWYVASSRVRDALGNDLQLWDVSPSAFHEPVWELSTFLYRRETAAFAPAEIIETNELDLPSTNGTMEINTALSNGTLSTRLERIHGRGSVTYNIQLPPGRGSNASSGGSLGQNGTYQVATNTRGQTTTVSVKADWPSVAVSELPAPGTYKFTLTAVDDQGREVPVVDGAPAGERRVIFLDTAEDAKRVRLKMFFQVGVKVEFQVAPPALPKE